MMNPKLIEQITKTAVQTALEYMDKERLQLQKVKRDRRLRNVKLLLKHYRSFESHCQELEAKLSAIEEAQTLNTLHDEDFAVESIKRSKQRTLVMVRFIKRMTEIYRYMCETSRNPEDIRRYKIIESLYLSEEKMTVEDLAKCHFIDDRTVYRDANEAAKSLQVLIFGIDGVNFE